MEYQIHFLDVGDADAIIIYYKDNASAKPIIVLVDAGNVDDAKKIKEYLREHFGTCYIDYAVCTHPDKDHKGGFFGLLEDEDVVMDTLLLKDPWSYLYMRDFKHVTTEGEAIKRARRAFEHPYDASRNLITEALKCGVSVHNVEDGQTFSDIPIRIVGPSEDYYREVALAITEEFAEITDEANFEDYDEKAKCDDETSKSVIDEDDDDSVTNKGSIILLFRPGAERFLLLGDATCESIADAITRYNLSNCIIKVPHHGSKHNMNTRIIDALAPRQSVISAQGSKKHPNSGLVYWLSKYGDVYSTHKSGNLYCTNGSILNPATPLRRKQIKLIKPSNIWLKRF